MPALNEVVRDHTDLDDDDLEWLHLLAFEWQVIADLSFADLVLWLADRDGTGYWAGGQVRPTTGPTAYEDDLVGEYVPRGRRPMMDAAYDGRRIVREGDPEWGDEVPVRVEAIPVLRGDRVIGVVARSTNLLGVRTPSRLELSYLQTASDLTRMISTGRFPAMGSRREWSAPQVGDGFLRTRSDGVVLYASPNAQTAYRRLGFTRDLVGEKFAELTQSLVPHSKVPTDETLSAVLSGSWARETEFGNAQATVIARVIPLWPTEKHDGAAVLLKDVTELRSRERELLTKDATIREIHHRVKNNLQTVAALLRLQARRMEVPEARAALDDAVKRVGSIALVHETLSHTLDEQVDFDEVSDRLSAMVAEVASSAPGIVISRKGSFGLLAGEVSTALAMALTELMHNAVEHGFAGRPGRLDLQVARSPRTLVVGVEDDGAGLPPSFDALTSEGLGLSIVRTLVESELGGSIAFRDVADGGTRVELTVPL